ncbi:hypothetical protein E8E12_006486 [Didymella heteroderae]|uniref:Uncharacterized protein n=1 Tax=Didymella heteroderae TaxID=1769908 RepID=A0A9P5C408_9PLEO|nr:hypothetical protein E8E12_006486 [Didymella heteroderae]
MHGRNLLLVAALGLPVISAPIPTAQVPSQSAAIINRRDVAVPSHIFRSLSIREPTAIATPEASVINEIEPSGDLEERGLNRGGGPKRDVAVEALDERGLNRGGGPKRGLNRRSGLKKDVGIDNLDERGLNRGGGPKRDVIAEALDERGLNRGGGPKRDVTVELFAERGLNRGGGPKRGLNRGGGPR